jgi:hypothetical protein
LASLTFKEIKARPVICKLTRPAVARIGAMTASVTSRQAANLAEIARCRRAARAPRPRACESFADSIRTGRTSLRRGRQCACI